MSPMNTTRAYGWAARAFHWTVAVLILAALGLGLYADNLPRGDESALQAIFAAFSIHKTAGVAVLVIASARILWTLSQIRPRPLHPERRLETLLAETVHWALWIGMIIMPLSGWLLHSAAPGGFSRILWPLGQRLPLVPEDAHLAVRHYRELAARDGYAASVRIYPGVPEVLRAVRAAGIPQATASSKPENQVLAILEHYALIDDFVVVAGAKPDVPGQHDSKAAVIGRALERLTQAGVDLSRPVLIGDRHHDVEGAAQFGIPVIFVDWGFSEPGESAGSVAEVATAEELRRILLPQA